MDTETQSIKLKLIKLGSEGPAFTHRQTDARVNDYATELRLYRKWGR